MSGLRSLLVDFGPLVVFFVANTTADILTATAAFMAATTIALAVSYGMDRRIPAVPVVSGVFILAFGALTLAFEDSFFIKIKPTVVNTLFCLALVTSQVLDVNLLRHALGHVVDLMPRGWQVLSWRYAGLFAFLAVLNEAIWRTQTEDFWVAFKTFGVMPITLMFSLLQVPVLSRYQIEPRTAADGADVPPPDPPAPE